MTATAAVESAPASSPSVASVVAEGATSTSARRSPKELIAATREFQKENRARSWFHLLETFGAFGLLSAVAAVAPWWPLRLAAALVNGLVIVRLFILYHDFMHNALLRGSSIAKGIMYAFGVYVLVPPNVWRQTHNYHHANTAKIVGSHVGSYLMVTTEMWAKMTPLERFGYRAQRHPLTIFFAYLTVFLYGMCVSPFLRSPRKSWDSLLALVLHVAATVAILLLAGWQAWLFVLLLPLFVATMAGAYLFYVQHNYPEINVQPRDQWEYTRAALESSSYLETGAVMAWFTGNIGYHHVHHLNPAIPFYRLPEAMAAIPELARPLGRTTLRPRDIVRAFACKLWHTALGKMVGYPR